VDIEKLVAFRENHPRLVVAVESVFRRFPTLERSLRSLPFVRAQVEREYASITEELERSLKPYRGQFETFDRLPVEGRSRKAILEDMEAMKKREEDRWKEGYVSGAVYHGDPSHIEFLNQVYALHSQANPLHSDLWPSASKFESEIISMAANMLGAGAAGGSCDPEGICGSVSSGGTESILLAMKSYRDRAREKYGIRTPEMVVPVTAHAAFDKASQYFQIKTRKIPIGSDYRADVKEAGKAINANTIVVVGSAPTFPHGVIDPIEELSELARERGVGFHTDACLGGFVLPWAKKLGYAVPAFDFRLPGVTSMSADTHKFGFAAKGTSVVLYRSWGLRHYQYYTTTDWPGGMYFSPTLAGSRPGALVAACWAAMISMGESGYIDAARKILETALTIKKGIASLPGLRVFGDPLFVIAFGSDEFDIYRVMDFMAKRHWNLNGLHRPACVHICVTLRHAQPGVAERFLSDLKDGVEHVRSTPAEKGGLAPVYGMGATIPVRSMVGDLLKRYMDLIYRL
jgi:glutamate/tyrosine decarboxylase-like PLP-dependent enzyme